MGGGMCGSGGGRRSGGFLHVNVLKTSVFGASDSETLRVFVRWCLGRLVNPSAWSGGVGNEYLSNDIRSGGLSCSLCGHGFVPRVTFASAAALENFLR